MTSCEFLNVAHAALVEEFQRPKLIQGIMVPGLSLTDALKSAAPWAEGYREDIEQEEGFSEVRNEVAAAEKPARSEEEIAAQNDAALAHLEGKMGGLIGGFFKT